MSTTSATTYAHECDMCGKTVASQNGRSPHARLYAEDPYHYDGNHHSHVGADVCSDCQVRPIIELIEHFQRLTRR